MRPLIDRENEQKLLGKTLQKRPSLAIVIGRRRIGKSFLLENIFRGDRVISIHGDEQHEVQQLELVAKEIGRSLFGTTAFSFRHWDEVFDLLTDQAQLAPITLILDEFQWFKAAQPALDSIIQRHWDRWDREELQITLVLCGSALTLMEQLLERNAPLYGRTTARVRLLPLDYRQAAAFSESQDPQQLLYRWAILGGTPQYQLWAGKGSIQEIVEEQIVTKGMPLYEEPLNLLRSGEAIRDPGTYLAILGAIASGARMHNEIAQQAKVPTGNLSLKLKRLEDLGYISPHYPLEPTQKQKRAAYEIADPYFRFWFRYVARNRSRIESGHSAAVAAEILTDLDNAMGWTFENCCRTWLRSYAQEHQNHNAQQIGSWWSRNGDAEIDITGIRGSRYVLLGSCKWRKVIDTDVLKDLIAQQKLLGGKAKDARLVLFAREDFSERLVRKAEQQSIQLIRLTELF